MKNKKNSHIAYFKCSFCGRDLAEGEVSLLDEFAQGVLFHADCAECKSSSLIIASGGARGVASLGMATDLEKDEFGSKFSGEAISADEIIDIYQCASNRGENFINLINSIKD